MTATLLDKKGRKTGRRYLLVDERLVEALGVSGLTVQEVAHGIHAQGIIYLLQICGFDGGYHYGWECIGPFSVDLAYAIDEFYISAVDDILEQDFPKETLQPAVRKLQALKKKRPIEMPDPLWLHLLCCVHFLEMRSGVAADGPKAPVYPKNSFRPEWIQQARLALSIAGLLS